MKNVLLITLVMLCGTMLLADTMPDFRLPDLDKKEVKLTDILGKGPVLVDFWASWCVSCKKAIPALNQLAQKYDSLTVVLVSIDAPKDIDKAKSFLKSNNFKLISLFDSEKKLAKKLNVVNPPRTLILDKTGEIVLTHEGYEHGTEKLYEQKIREMLSLPSEEPSETEENQKNEGKHDKKHPCGGCE